jgi:hypothetical protein
MSADIYDIIQRSLLFLCVLPYSIEVLLAIKKDAAGKDPLSTFHISDKSVCWNHNARKGVFQ